MRKRPSRRLYSQKKKSKSRKNFDKSKVFVFLVIILMLILAWRIFLYVPKYTVSKSQWYYSEETIAKVFYNSTPIISPNKGNIHIEVSSGSKVDQGQDIFVVADSEKESSLRDKIKEIELELQSYDIGELEEPSEMIISETPLNDLRSMVRLYGFYQSELKTSKTNQSFNSVNELEKEYFSYINQIKNNQIEYESLKEELSRLEAEYNQCSEICTSPTKGVLMYQYDNLNELESNEDISTNYQSFMDVEIQKVVVNDGDSVRIGDQVGIVVDNDLFYLGVKFSSEIAYYLSLANEIRIGLNGEDINHEMLDEDFDKLAILISTSKNLDISNRKIKVNISTEKLDGFYIPKESVIIEEDIFYVYVYDGRHPVKTEVDILKTQEDRYFVSGLKDGDQIVEDIGEFRR